MSDEVNPSIILGCYGISFRWTTKGPWIADEVSFELKRGEILALLGPNGSGKSTLLKTIAGIYSLKHSGGSGYVRYLGRDFLTVPAANRAQRVVYVGTELRADFPLTAEETVFLGRMSYRGGLMGQPYPEDYEAVKWAMEESLCWSLRERHLDTLSGGELQLVAMARALAQGSRVLLLDETLSKMDLHHQAAIGKMLKRRAEDGSAVILVSHDVNLATEWADSALFLRQGKKILHGTIQDIITQENMNKLYPNADLVVGANPVTGAPKVYFSST